MTDSIYALSLHHSYSSDGARAVLTRRQLNIRLYLRSLNLSSNGFTARFWYNRW